MASLPRHGFEPDRSWWEQVLATVDRRDAAAFTALLTPDAHFRFGNIAPIVGRDAIAAAVGGFFAAIAACRHRLLNTWNSPEAIACEGEVTYTRHDASTLTVPFANVFELRGHLIASYRIYIDNSQLLR
jgi:limonene-1,2-epoxide hydrolase